MGRQACMHSCTAARASEPQVDRRPMRIPMPETVFAGCEGGVGCSLAVALAPHMSQSSPSAPPSGLHCIVRCTSIRPLALAGLLIGSVRLHCTVPHHFPATACRCDARRIDVYRCGQVDRESLSLCRARDPIRSDATPARVRESCIFYELVMMMQTAIGRQRPEARTTTLWLHAVACGGRCACPFWI